MTITPTVRDGVEAVGDGDDPGRQRDPLPLQATRIARTIPALVMRGNTFSQVGVKRAERGENFRAPLRVCPDRAPFLGS
ncbi:MAG TPA: hypothetical protein VK542_04110 [Gemmatimonadaceae bacterium]|nr:hypothetical protein [Gemmatimonadaceae bacterium]